MTPGVSVGVGGGVGGFSVGGSVGSHSEQILVSRSQLQPRSFRSQSSSFVNPSQLVTGGSVGGSVGVGVGVGAFVGGSVGSSPSEHNFSTRSQEQP